MSDRLDTPEVLGSFPSLVAAGTPAPGGGSVAAHCGLMAASLGQMVCNITIGKPKFADREPRLREIRDELERLGTRLRFLISEDAASFEAVLEAYRLPRESEEQKATRSARIEEATWGAVNVPLETAEQSAEVSVLLREIADLGNPNALSDAAVGARMAEVAIRGASYNVMINLNSLSNHDKGAQIHDRLKAMIEAAETAANEVESKIS